jgi:hypothetical protein
MSGIRYIGEATHIPEAFVAFAPLTENKMLALMAAHYGRVDPEGKTTTSPFISGHAMWYTSSFNAKMQTRNFLAGKLDHKTVGPMCEEWTWANCVRIFGEGYSATYWSTDNKVKQIKGPVVAGPRYEKDIFGSVYRVTSGIPVKEWFNAFTEEMTKWEQECPPST